MPDPTLLSKLKALFNGRQRAGAPRTADSPSRLDAGSNRGSGNANGQVRATTDAPDQIAFDYEDRRIPEASKAKILRIRDLATAIEEQAKVANKGLTNGANEALHEARRIERIYMPKLMGSYFDIPAAHRTEIFRTTGRSASYLLNERLDKLVGQMADISAEFARGQIDTFSVNLGFIDERFGSSKSPFDLG